MPRPSRQRGTDDRGAAAVEFALVWVLVALMLLGTIQFGIVFSQWLQLCHAAREGARWGALRNPVASVVTRVRASAPFASTANVAVSPDPMGAMPGDPITVTVTRQVDTPLTNARPAPNAPPIAGGNLVLTARATMRAE